ncbi:flavodoxin family protein [Methanobacterium aggregans]|uniref:flavodoxin family protein n=1 Tax=Methanobacterium aggregans TaxID=1615586 RepID=UPI001AE6F802|nr:flavodoxin family protein [Methanobacterium aggregans]MBP2045621.1 flavodoxin [Methanobacterium aggregans]
MKTAVIYYSSHHGNTKKIAEKLSEALEGKLFEYTDVDKYNTVDYNLIGFGSGIYHGKPAKEFLEFLEELPDVKNIKAFVFTTSGKGTDNYNNILKEELEAKGFEVVGEFSCKAFDTWGPLKIIGGKNKGKPNEEDFKRTEEFAKNLKERLNSS